MLKTHALITLFLLSTVTCFAQLSGVKTIPGDYATLSAAVTALNTQGVGTGGVILNIAAGYTETAPAGGIILTTTGTAANSILIQKSGSGANPKITATDAGTISTSVFGGQGDAVMIIEGSDYVTFNGVDVAATQSGIEYGYYLRKASGTNGCKNVSITNAGITMTKGTSAYVVGIYSSNNSSTSAASSAAGVTITSVSGINENIIFTGNAISNVFAGIVAIGYNAPSPYSLYDQNFTIGADELGNTIQNFAGNATSSSYAIYTMYVKSADISYNTIANAANGGAAATGTLSGIYFGTNASSSGNYVANNNIITLSQSSTAAVNFIYNGNTVTSFTANGNSFSAGSFASTATSYLIYNNNNTTAIVVNNNRTVGAITKTGEGSFYGYYNNGGGPVAATAIYSGNNFSNITVTTGFNEFAGIYSSFIGNQVYTITNNTISNITGNNSSMFGIRVSYGVANSVISGNTITSISGGFTVIGLRQDFYTGNMPLNIFNNTISNVNGAQVFGLYCGGMNSTNIYKNKIYGLAGTTSSGFVSAITLVGGVSGTTNSLFNNLIGDLSSPATNSLSDAIRGISINDVNSNYNTNLYYNTIYINAASSGVNFSTSAIYQVANSNATAGVLTLLNNILVNTSVAKGSGTTSVFRRLGTALTNYAPGSNNNLFYAGSPSASNLLYSDGTNTAPTLADLKALVSPRESASVTENPPFASTTGSATNYLHISGSAPTQTNNGGTPVTGITDDYDGDVRNMATPDIGADEFNVALPITLQFLKGQKIGSGNALNWKVACTSVSITMEMERSSDSRSFKSITSITASQARCNQPFDYVDASPLKGTNYYRLKMIDVDGSISYSPIVAVINGTSGAELVGIYPTVVRDEAFVSVAASRSTKLQINITDMSGRIIKTINQTVANGSTLLSINTANLATGVYNITGMLDGAKTKTLRFVKQ